MSRELESNVNMDCAIKELAKSFQIILRIKDKEEIDSARGKSFVEGYFRTYSRTKLQELTKGRLTFQQSSNYDEEIEILSNKFYEELGR